MSRENILKRGNKTENVWTLGNIAISAPKTAVYEEYNKECLD